MDINIQILIGGRGTGVFLGEQRKDMNECSTSWEDKCCCFPANREEQQGRGYSGAPEDSPAEGKVILKLRHKSADELQRQLKQLPHRRRMPGPHKASVLMCPCKALCLFRARTGVKMKHVKKEHAWCLLSAICHLRSYQQGWEQSQRIINMFEGNHESEPLGQEFLSLSKPFLRHYVFSNACMQRTLEPDPQPSTELLFWLKDHILSNDTIKLMFSRNNWVSGHGAAKLVVM